MLIRAALCSLLCSALVENLLWCILPVSSASVLFSGHAQCLGRTVERVWMCVWWCCWRQKMGGGALCYQGDENTRLYTAAAVLCNRTVTMTMFKGKGWRRGKAQYVYGETVQIWTSMHKLDTISPKKPRVGLEEWELLRSSYVEGLMQ